MTIDTPASGARPEDASAARPRIDHIPLEDLEVRVECVRFVTIFAAAWFIYSVGHGALWALSGDWPPGWWAGSLGVHVILAAALFACLWILSAARTSAGFAVAIFLAVLVVVKTISVIKVDVSLGRQPTGWSIPLAFLGGIYISYQVVRIGWIARPAPSDQQAFIAATPKELIRLRTILLRVFGIPPIWAWLPTARQKVSAFLLFALSMLLFSHVVFLLMGELTTFPLTAEQFATQSQQCIRLHGNSDECDQDYWETILTYPIPLTAIYGAAFGVVGLLRYCARRSVRLSLEGLLSKDPRPAILFLRSFRDDQVKLVRPRRRLFLRIVAFGEPRPTLDHILLEEATPFGPVIAIGAPGSRPPFGAARKYVTNDQWQATVHELAQSSGSVVIALDETEGVSWEVKTLFVGEHRSKILFLLPPRLTAPHDAQRIISLLFTTTSAMKIMAEAISEFVSRVQRPCVGWYLGHDGGLRVLTTRRPSHLSYVLAVRMFVRGREHASSQQQGYSDS